MTFIDSWAGLATGFGTLLVGLAAIIAQGLTIWSKHPREPAWRRIKKVLRSLLNWISALALAVSLGGLIIIITHKPPQCQPPTLSITSPVAGATVNVGEIADGTVTCLSAGQHVWLVLKADVTGGGEYFPANVVSVAGSRWSTTVNFGRQSPVDNGVRFTLLATIANDAADQRFRNWLAAGQTNGNFPALGDLTGATVLAQVTVIRGPA